NDYFYGPIADDYTSPEYIQRYNRLWKVTSSEVNAHIAGYMNEGYVVPSPILSWPGNGNTDNGEAANLAPYIDANSNGVYDPENGDYPDIRGEVAIFYILNDDKQTHTASSGGKIGVEIHGMVYVYYDFN